MIRLKQKTSVLRIWLPIIVLFVFFKHVDGQEQWSSPITIGPGISPGIAVQKTSGTLHVLSTQDGVGVFYSQYDASGNLLVSPELIPGSQVDPGGWTFNAAIAVDGDNIPHVCYREIVWPNNHVNYRRRVNGNWTTAVNLAAYEYRAYQIRMATDAVNRAHVVRITSVDELNGILTYHSLYNNILLQTQSWQEEYRVDMQLAVDTFGNDNLYFVTGVPKYPDGTINVYQSVDGGNTIDYVDEIHHSQATFRNGAPDLFVDALGNRHIVYGTTIDNDVGQTPSIRYVRYEGNSIVRHDVVTSQDELEWWEPGTGVGLSSVASSADGKVVVIAYVTSRIGDLKVIVSRDRGATWSTPQVIANNVDSQVDGRTKHMLRAYNNNFYIVYAETSDPGDSDPSDCTSKMRYALNVTDQLNANVYGQVLYAVDDRPVPDVTINWVENGSVSTTTGVDGSYSITQIPLESTVTIEPSKAADYANTPLRSYDAALAARAAVGLWVEYTDTQKELADVDGDGEITLYDAVQIARYVVGFSMPQGVDAGAWTFTPENIHFASLSTNQSGQNFTARLMGDIHGGWGSGTLDRTHSESATLIVEPPTFHEDSIFVPVTWSGTDILAVDFNCNFDPNTLSLTSVKLSEPSNGTYLNYRHDGAGEVRVGLFSLKPMDPNPTILLAFRRVENKNSHLDFNQIFINTTRAPDLSVPLDMTAAALTGLQDERLILYPNPYNDNVTILYRLDFPSDVRLSILNLRGQEIIVLQDEVQEAGTYRIKWNGLDRFGKISPSGLYLAVLQYGNRTMVRRMEKLR